MPVAHARERDRMARLPCLSGLVAPIAVGLLAGLGCLMAAPASASPLLFNPFSGQGNVSVFDAGAGTGGWVGSLDGLTDPTGGQVAPAVTTVLFTLDPLTHALAGSFSFTTTDLASTLSGLLHGTASRDDILSQGGQFSLDYTITSGSGLFEGARGYGLAFLEFDAFAAAGSDNYHESGLAVYAVPEPSSLLLAWLALGLLAGTVNASAGTRRQ